jgi:molecular chaperone DnaK
LSDDEIQQMIKDAEANAQSDTERRKLVEARNSSESLLNEVNVDLTKYRDQLTSEEVTKIETAVQNLKDSVVKDNTTDIEESLNKLQEARMPLLTKKYEDEAKSQQSASENASSAPNTENVVDADFSEIKQKAA